MSNMLTKTTWHHIVSIVNEKGERKVYLDGAKQANSEYTDYCGETDANGIWVKF